MQANLRHIAAFARQMPSAGSLTGEFGRASLGDGWEVEWFIILQAGKKDLYEVLVKGRGIVGLPRDVLIGVNCRALV